MKVFCCIIIICLLSNCNPDNQTGAVSTTELKELRIDSILSKNIYSTKAVIKSRELRLKMTVPQTEFYNANKLRLIRALSICEIENELDSIDQIYFEQIDTSKKETFAPQKTLIKTRDGFKDLLTLHSNKMNNDFEYYILKNMSGERLYEYWGIIKAIYIASNIQDAPPDYITVVLELAKEYEKGDCNGYYRKLMIKIKETGVILRNTENFVFNEEDIDYFLRYKKCG